MKKKVLSLLVIILLLLMLLIWIESRNKEKISKEQEGTTQNSSQTTTSSKEKIQVKEVKATSENYAVVTGTDNNTYITDKDGNCQGTINLTNNIVFISKNGYVCTTPDYNSEIIYDKTGKEVLKSESQDVRYIFGVSDNDLLIRKTKESSFSGGSSSKCEIIDINGNVKHQLESMINPNWAFLGNDLFIERNSGTIYDAYANKNIETKGKEATSEGKNLAQYVDISLNSNWRYKIVKENDNILVIGNSLYRINNNNEIFKLNNDQDVLLNNKYYYDYNKKSICDYKGNIVKDLTEGNGAYKIGYFNNKYYIRSGTGYYYILNDNFNYILEPIDIKNTSFMNINSYGIIYMETGAAKNSTIYDLNFENPNELQYKLNETKYFIAEIESSLNGTTEYYNLSAQEKLVISK